MKKVLFYLFTLLISTNIVFAEHLDNEMNVMSFNIRMSTKSDGANWWEYRKDLAANVIKFYDVDMFGAQEVLHNQLTDLLDRLPDYGYVGVGREDGKTKGEYSPILYRKDRFSVVKSGNRETILSVKVSILLSFTERIVSLLSKVAISGWRKI